jgi:hypothetical protein
MNKHDNKFNTVQWFLRYTCFLDMAPDLFFAMWCTNRLMERHYPQWLMVDLGVEHMGAVCIIDTLTIVRRNPHG